MPTKQVIPQRAITSRLVADFCKRFRQARTLSFTVDFLSHMEDQFGLMTMNWFTVVAKRPNQFAIRGGAGFRYEPKEKDGRHLTFIGSFDTVCISNGKAMLDYSPGIRAYKTASAPATMADVKTAPFEAIRASVVLGSDLLAGYESAPDENLNITTPVLVFVQKETSSNPRLAKYSFRNKLYFSTKTGELLRYSQFVRFPEATEEIEQHQMNYDNWKFNAKLPADAFDTTPPRNSVSQEELRKAIKSAQEKKQ